MSTKIKSSVGGKNHVKGKCNRQVATLFLVRRENLNIVNVNPPNTIIYLIIMKQNINGESIIWIQKIERM